MPEADIAGSLTQLLVIRPLRAPSWETYCLNNQFITTQDMGKVPGAFIAGALVPALIITILFYFDHSVSSQLAQVRPCCSGNDYVSRNLLCLGLLND